MSAYGSLKHSARSWSAASPPLPWLLDFLAPAWAFPANAAEDAFFEPSFKPAFSFGSCFPSTPVSIDEASSSSQPASAAKQTYTHVVSIRQAMPVALTGYTSANYGLASPEWAAAGPSSRTFASPWRSQPPHFSALVAQRQITTLPQNATVQDHASSSSASAGASAGIASSKTARSPSQVVRDRLAHLEDGVRESDWEREWTHILRMFWQHRMFRDPDQLLHFSSALLGQGLLLEAWDVRKVYLRWAKQHDITLSSSTHQVMDSIRDASLKRPHVRRESAKQKERSMLSRHAWFNVSGMNFSPTLHRILLDKSTFQKAFYAFKSVWPPMRTMADYEAFIVAACHADDTSAIELLWLELDASPSFKPTSRILRNTISHFARRRDPDSVEYLVHQMQNQQLRITRNQWTDLMRAHIASANWSAVSSVFRRMEEAEKERERPDIVAINVVLRAEVLAGAPFNIIRSLVASLPARGYQPDHLTMAILMESAVDLGLLGPAETVFAQMDASSELKPNVVHFGIMIKAYLLRGNTDVAQEYLDEMLKRGIDASAVIYAQIIRAYLAHAAANKDDEVAMQSAQSFAEEFSQMQQQDARSKTKRKSDTKGLSSVMVPFIASFARDFRPELALEFFQKIIQAQQVPNSFAYATLLDAYRRVGDTAAMTTVWNGLYEQSLKDTASLTKLGEPKIRGRANYLCVPLSTMIQGLGPARQFDQLSAIWQQMHQDGFGFDCSNWNHLCQALISGDSWQSACTIAEQVLLTPEAPARSDDVLSAQRVNTGTEGPSRSHQERSAEREMEQKRERHSARQLQRAADGVVERSFLDAFKGTSERYFWRLQRKSKDAFLAEHGRRFARASPADQAGWEEEYPRLARVVHQHRLQRSNEGTAS